MTDQRSTTTIHMLSTTTQMIRRGNTIVLVTGILVLLVIIATAYVSRTQAGRETSTSVQRMEARDDSIEFIADAIATEISEALFVRPAPGAPGTLVNSNTPRFPIQSTAVRYGRDIQDNDGNGLLDFSYNFAPYHVVPFTNWPDAHVGVNPGILPGYWPPGPGNPNSGSGPQPAADSLSFLASAGNPIGMPGYGDCRWLRDIEPSRFHTFNNFNPNAPAVWNPDAFSHWLHMTNIARPENGWRIVTDIANVERVTPVGTVLRLGGIVRDLRVPVEQWLNIIPGSPSYETGEARFPGMATFETQWMLWFGLSNLANADALLIHQGVHAVREDIPPNFYRLSDLNGDGILHNYIINNQTQDRPEDEFVPGTARWNVSRVLCDTDGDGYTDAFWFLAPGGVNSGIRQVVAISIIDNAAMANLNVATRFHRNDADFGADIRETRGTYPTDLALVGQRSNNPASPMSTIFVSFMANNPNNFNVGLFDSVENWYANFGYNFTRWHSPPDNQGNYNDEFLHAIGLLNNGAFNEHAPNAAARLDYWRRAASMSLGASLDTRYTPFGIPEEIELRSFQGQNLPWTYSRLERAFSVPFDENFGGVLRSTRWREESSEFLDQLWNRALVKDLRHRVTVYNSTRNDLLPPWLWDNPNIAERKLDLRHATFANNVDLNGNGNPADDAIERLQRVVERALRDPLTSSPVVTYFGAAATDIDKVREAAAGFTANLLQRRDTGSVVTLGDALMPLGDPGDPPSNFRFLGMEKQPFLVEVFIGHVHAAETAEFDHPQNGINAGDYVICDSQDNQSTVVVVQVANPYDTALDLGCFKLGVYGKTISLTGSIAPNDAKTFYVIDGQLNGDPNFRTKWVQALNLAEGIAAGFDVLAAVPAEPDPWSTDRDHYNDSANHNRAVELYRMDNCADPASTPILVDRIDIINPPSQPDNLEVGDGMEELHTAWEALSTDSCVEPPANAPWNVQLADNTHWIQWVHATRAWQLGPNPDPENRKNPRFVFADREVNVNAIGRFFNGTAASGDTWFDPPLSTGFDKRDKGFTGVDDRLQFPLQMLQKDSDFEQAGEIYNVWMFGHKLRFTGGVLDNSDPAGDGGTETTFSEFLGDYEGTTTPPYMETVGTGIFVNRILPRPMDVNPSPGTGPNNVHPLGWVIGLGDPANYQDPRHGHPELPAGVRLADAFVCDGQGLNSTTGFFYNAKGFDGTGTPGLLNINTAPLEVLRIAPHWYRMVHETGEVGGTPQYGAYGDNASIADPNNPNITPIPALQLVTTGTDAAARLPRTMLSEALWHYRDRLGGGGADWGGFFGGPNYVYRDRLYDPNNPFNPAPPQLPPSAAARRSRGDRGMASLGEILMLNVPAKAYAPLMKNYFGGGIFEPIYRGAWTIDAGAATWRHPQEAQGYGWLGKPFWSASNPTPADQRSMQLSTDVSSSTNVSDNVAGDSEEASLLFSGVSNLFTTRSDTFTVYFRVRSFRQNTNVSPPVWDATNPEFIVDDTRYVMLVDRSTVNRPTDKPKILYMERLPK